MNENPVKRARKALHLTQAALSAVTGVGTDTIIRTEQGLYNHVPPALQDVLKVPDADYQAWRKACRKAAYGQLFMGHEPGYHPLALMLRDSALTEIGFCKLLCLHRAVIYKFLHQPHLYNTPPVGLLEAFADAGYSADWIASFVTKWQAYKAHRLKRAG